MCKKPPISWMLIQIFRAVADEGSCPPECLDWLRAHNLESLGGLIPPLVDLVEKSVGSGVFSSTPDDGPTQTEMGLLGAIASSCRDPDQSQQLLASVLPPHAAHQAEDWVRAIDIVLRDLRPAGIQRIPPTRFGATIH